MQTRYFHVFVRGKGEDLDRPLLLDLTEQDLRLRVLNPYNDSKDIYDQGHITRVSDIARITILQSQTSAAEVLKKMASDHEAELQRILKEEGCQVLGSYRGRKPSELVGYCPDVTEKYIGIAPGSGSEWTKIIRFLNNPWVVRGGILLLGILIGKVWSGV